ncbi:hypothetical protein ACFLWO_02795 [Chloroflexota bacterium]
MNYKAFCILALATSLSLVAMVAIPAMPVLAQSISLSPSTGPKGTRVVVTGTAFDSDKNQNVGLYFDHDWIKNVEVSENGTFSTHFYVPGHVESRWSYDVTILNRYGREVAKTQFLVTREIKLDPTIKLSPSTGPRGAGVVVTGTAFNSDKNQNVELYFDHDWIKSVEVSETGTFSTYFYVSHYIGPGKSYDVTILNRYDGELAREQFFVAPEIKLDPDEGKIGNWINIDGYGFDTNKIVDIYFSSNTADIGTYIDDTVTAYEVIGKVFTKDSRKFDISFKIPDKLVDGEDKEDVHGGDYYVYAAYYFADKYIETVAKFVVIGGQIMLDPDEGRVGTLVEISGEGFRNNQKVTIKYDGNVVPIIIGDRETDSDGKFSCLILIPESTAGNHIVTAIDESGNKPEAEVSVESRITIAPSSTVMGNTVKVSGTGFGAEENVAITFDGDEVLTTPTLVETNHNGSFDSSFVIPSYPYYADGGAYKIEAYGESLNVPEAQLIILLAIPPTPPGVRLHPTTSRTSPGHVGMELTADGTGFTANATVSINYSNGEAIIRATATADASGNFSATFTVPPSLAGDHAVTSTDGTNSVTSNFTMESEAPPVPSLSEFVAPTEAKAYFDWEDVTDSSGVTYTLQVASDTDFTTIVLEEKVLTDSEYTIIEEEKLKATKKETPYYWRVKAVDGAANESEWTPPGLLYVVYDDFPQASRTREAVSTWDIGRWVLSIGISVGLIVSLLLITLWFRRRRGTAGQSADSTN